MVVCIRCAFSAFDFSYCSCGLSSAIAAAFQAQVANTIGLILQVRAEAAQGGNAKGNFDRGVDVARSVSLVVYPSIYPPIPVHAELPLQVSTDPGVYTLSR